ncbi:hypothetical protein KQY10_13505, partial [Leptospira interrogans]|nr:hypothetical protein [Leptospira interrogans]
MLTFEFILKINNLINTSEYTYIIKPLCLINIKIYSIFVPNITPTSDNVSYVPSRGNWGRGVVHGGDPLYQKAVVQLVGESPIRVNAREP